MDPLVPVGAPGSLDYGRYGVLVQPSCDSPHQKGAWVKNLKLTLKGAVLMDAKECNLYLALTGAGRADSVMLVSLDESAVAGYRCAEKRVDALHKNFVIALRGQIHMPESADGELSSLDARGELHEDWLGQVPGRVLPLVGTSIVCVVEEKAPTAAGEFSSIVWWMIWISQKQGSMDVMPCPMRRSAHTH
jgi:hypothetical protein